MFVCQSNQPPPPSRLPLYSASDIVGTRRAAGMGLTEEVNPMHFFLPHRDSGYKVGSRIMDGALTGSSWQSLTGHAKADWQWQEWKFHESIKFCVMHWYTSQSGLYAKSVHQSDFIIVWPLTGYRGLGKCSPHSPWVGYICLEHWPTQSTRMLLSPHAMA